MYIDYYYLILVVPAMIFAMVAQFRVKSAFGRYSRERTQRGITGAEAARQVLARNGVHHVRIERTPGHLSDHYDPQAGVIRLSPEVHDAATVAAVGVAAHEAGHAAQYAHGYMPIHIRSAIIPMSRFGSGLSWPLILVGLFLNSGIFFYIGIALFGLAVLFQLITLPVEYNASRRAMTALGDGGVLEPDELPGARKVLNAAALTYLAALAVSIAQLLRLLLMFGGGRRRD